MECALYRGITGIYRHEASHDVLSSVVVAHISLSTPQPSSASLTRRYHLSMTSTLPTLATNLADGSFEAWKRCLDALV